MRHRQRSENVQRHERPGAKDDTRTPRARRQRGVQAPNPVQAERKILVTFRLHESIVARCHQIKEEAVIRGRFPWKTIGEVYRGLIIRGLESMKGDPIIDDALPYLRLVKQVEGMKQPRTEAESCLHNTQTEIARLLSIGAKREAQQFYQSAVEIAESMAPTIWRDWLLGELSRVYPELAKGTAQGVSVTRRKTGHKGRGKK